MSRIRPDRAKLQRTLELARHLPERDRLLVAMVLVETRSIGDIAHRTNTPKYRMKRKIRRVFRQLADPRYAFLCAYGHKLDPVTRRVGAQVIFRGRSMRLAAEHLQTTIHEIRRHLQTLSDLARI